MSIPFHRRAALALASALVAAGGAPGLAQAANPAPCGGVPLIEDFTGDALVKPLGGLGSSTRSHPGTDNEDVESAWLSWSGTQLTANVKLANLDLTAPPPSDSQGGIAYYVFWQDGQTVRFVRAQNQLGQGFTYGIGHIQEISANGIGLFSVYLTDSAIPGKLFQGKHGVVQMTIPGAKAGQRFGGVEAFADGFNGGPDDVSGLNNHFDSAPDEADPSAPNGFDYTARTCTAAAAARR